LIPTYGPGVFTPYIENQFYINKDGERFIKEDGRRDELARAILEQKDKQIYIISDANTVKDGVVKSGKNIDEKIGNGYAFKADTLEELAEQIGISYEKLQASVDEFNNSLRNGNDPFGRQLFDKEFGVGPFYAGLTGPMVHHTMGGIKINEKAQAVNKDGNIIAGLYAAGEVTGGIHGSNRLGGNAIADITVFGRVAGVNAAAEEAISK
ncbi:MAG: FAD-binding protein, partial [Cetobacterium sp.]|uniref:FAD-dependent oxidoreductase n=1 Tax=Cetobacterium sp. TaxID=2071632 RepID=UPI002FC9D8C1